MTLGRILFEAAGLWADADWTRDAMGLAYGKLADAAATNGGPSIDDPDDVETQRYRDWACDVLDCNHPALADMDVTIRTHMIPARIGLPSVRSVWNDKPTVGVFNSRFEIAVGVECELCAPGIWNRRHDGRVYARRLRKYRGRFAGNRSSSCAGLTILQMQRAGTPPELARPRMRSAGM
jgi:hypothetical protein